MRSERLRDYCEAVRRLPAQWGVDDCSTWAAEWARRETGIALDLTHYRSKDEAMALIAAAGTLDALWRAALVSLPETAEPRSGDVCVVETRRFGQVGAIVARPGVIAWRAEAGVHVFAPNPKFVIKAWALP